LARADLAETGRASRDKQLGLSDGRTTPSPFAATLASTGMSRQTAHRYQALAAVPEKDFEAPLAGPDKTKTACSQARG
jgi:hypothetical protein